MKEATSRSGLAVVVLVCAALVGAALGARTSQNHYRQEAVDRDLAEWGQDSDGYPEWRWATEPCVTCAASFFIGPPVAKSGPVVR